jgi:UDP-glucose 4-epimerase
VRGSVTDPRLAERLRGERIDSAIHAAFTFDPTHDIARQDAVDIDGTRNIVGLVEKLKISHLLYLSSTTSYGPLPENPWKEPFLKESDWLKYARIRLRVDYRYSRNKAYTDLMIQSFARECPEKTVGWLRPSIVIGPHTRNIVSYVAESPFTLGKFMFRVKGYDPPMQFISEEDMSEVLYRATIERWRGPVNVAGEGTVRCSELIEAMGRKELAWSEKILYPAVSALWNMRILDFPPSLLDLIRYPWVADISRLKDEFGFTPKHTSREALDQFARARMGR